MLVLNEEKKDCCGVNGTGIRVIGCLSDSVLLQAASRRPTVKYFLTATCPRVFYSLCGD